METPTPNPNGRKHYRFKANDIKHVVGPNALSNDQICDIPLQQVYIWCREGKWKTKDFMKWAKALRITE